MITDEKNTSRGYRSNRVRGSSAALFDRRGFRVALATCRELPELDRESRRLASALERLGVRAVPAVWDDPSVVWQGFDLVVVRSCWDYIYRREEFLQWADQIPRIKNPPEVCRWNSDKRYLAELQRQGIPVVPTNWIEPDKTWLPPTTGEWVMKPAVSICAVGAGRYDLADPTHRGQASQHFQRLKHTFQTTMLQPYLTGVDREGETALVYFGERFSHAVRKPAILSGPDNGQDRRFQHLGGINPVPVTATREQLAIGERVLSLVPGGVSSLLYARVDLVPGENGEPLLLELEVIEPNLFLMFTETGLDALTAQIEACIVTDHDAPRGGNGLFQPNRQTLLKRQ